MSNVRVGAYGTYYGSYFDESVALNTAQKEVNAYYIYLYLSAKGWTLHAISGILGNMENESAINPGRWQSNKVGKLSGGYSLVQWTPASKYINWCTAQGLEDPSEMDNALARIIYELEHNQQYARTSTYKETFYEFSRSTKSPYYLACAFAWNYERSYVVIHGTETQKEALRKRRGNSAEKWYEFLSGEAPPIRPHVPGERPKRKNYNFVLFSKRRRM